MKADEWDFSGVPKEEIPFCLIYELARESTYLAKLTSEFKKHGNSRGPSNPLQPNVIAGIVPRISFPYHDQALVTLIFHGASWRESLPPWLSLSPAQRTHLIGQLARNEAVFTGLAHFHTALLQTALNEGKLTTKPGRTLPDASYVQADGRELVLLVIDWKCFNGVAIRQALLDWFESRKHPAQMDPAVIKGRGKKRSDLQHQLINLGYSRLRSRYTPKQVFRAARKAWDYLIRKDYNTETATQFEKAVAKRITSFQTFFAKVFPFDKRPPKSILEFMARRSRSGPPRSQGAPL
ncbi:MAG: hypothetical protein FJ405_13740 [Verrucomicrobia bacterium]|nr:hypothetical protein [Verrucomicrobiota bacterium]